MLGIAPMRLLRIPEPFDPEWTFEPKVDGFRAIARVHGHRCAVLGVCAPWNCGTLVPPIGRSHANSRVICGPVSQRDFAKQEELSRS